MKFEHSLAYHKPSGYKSNYVNIELTVSKCYHILLREKIFPITII